MNITIPKSLLDAMAKLPWAENGMLNELPAGGNATFSNTHTDYADPYGTPIDEFNPRPDINGANKVSLYANNISADWVVTELPPRGTAVWQIKGRTPQIVRTSVLQNYGIGQFVLGVLSPAGPAPGVPIGGDSGSLCFVRKNGRWLVLGIVNFGSTVSLPFWTTPLTTKAGRVLAATANTSAVRPIFEQPEWSSDWIAPGEPQTTLMRELILSQIPATRRVIGMHELGDDGTDNIVIDVPFVSDVASINSVSIRGAGTDHWYWPDNFANWHTRGVILPGDGLRNGVLRLWFKASQPTSSYDVSINGQPVVRVAPLSVSVFPAPAPGTVPVTDVPKPTTPAPEASEYDQTIADLRARVGELLDENERSQKFADKLCKDITALINEKLELELQRDNARAELNSVIDALNVLEHAKSLPRRA